MKDLMCQGWMVSPVYGNVVNVQSGVTGPVFSLLAGAGLIWMPLESAYQVRE